MERSHMTWVRKCFLRKYNLSSNILIHSAIAKKRLGYI